MSKMDNPPQRDVLAEARSMLQQPSRNTKRNILIAVNLTAIFAIILHFIIQIVQFGHLPDPGRDLVSFSIILAIHSFSAVYNLTHIYKQTEGSPRWQNFTAWSSVVVLMLIALTSVHSNPNTAISLLFDFALSVITLFIVGTVLSRKVAIVWFFIAFISLFLAWKNRGSHFEYHLMTQQEIASYKQDLAAQKPTALIRQQALEREHLAPFPVGLYVSIWVIFLLYAMGATFFESSMIDNILKAIPKVIQKIQIAADEKSYLEQENARMGMELDVARRIQNMVLPKETEWKDYTDLDIAAKMQSAQEVGGDYYEILPQKNRSIYFSIGDVTDHGLESGVIMLMTQTAIRTSIDEQPASLRKTLQQVNAVLYSNISARLEDKRNLTLCLLRYADNKITFCGQHESILVYRAKAQTIEEIETINSGMYVGMIDDIEPFLEEKTLTLEKDDVLVLYTDGVTEAENRRGEFYGMGRFIEAVKARVRQPSKAIINGLFEDIHHFIEGQALYDDITLMVIKKM